MAEDSKPPPTNAAKTAAEPAPKPKKPRSALMLRFFQSLSELRAQWGEVWGGLFSNDSPSRRMATLFLASLFGAITVLGVSFYHIRQYYRDQAQGLSAEDEEKRRIGEFMKKRSEEGKQRYNSLNLGKFVVEIAPVPDAPTPPKGVMQLAEIEFVAQCDDKDTCFYIEDHMVQAQNEITDALNVLNREEVLSHVGKRRIRDAVRARLNRWLPKGKVEDLFIPSMIIS
jgi:flagellar basal body-associated protein FliL